jgi:hypothetical protein
MKLSNLERLNGIARRHDRLRRARDWLDLRPGGAVDAGLNWEGESRDGRTVTMPAAVLLSAIDGLIAECDAELRLLGVEP